MKYSNYDMSYMMHYVKHRPTLQRNLEWCTDADQIEQLTWKLTYVDAWRQVHRPDNKEGIRDD